MIMGQFEGDEVLEEEKKKKNKQSECASAGEVGRGGTFYVLFYISGFKGVSPLHMTISLHSKT